MIDNLSSLKDSLEENKSRAITCIYERFKWQISAHIYHLLDNREDADDVLQEVFVRVCIHWDTLRDHGNISSWLYHVATNLCIDRIRRRRHISFPRSLSYSTGQSFDAIIEDGSLCIMANDSISTVAEREHIQLALARMPKKYADVLVLNVWQGFAYEEIAMHIGLSPSATVTMLTRAKKAFIQHYRFLLS